METKEAIYKLVREHETQNFNTITRVEPEHVNLHVACGKCGKGIIIVINLKKFKTSGAESCCEQRLDVSVKKEQLDEEEEEATVGILSVVGNFKIQAQEISDNDVEWCAKFGDDSFLRFRTKDQSWNSSGSDKKMKKLQRMGFLPKKAREKRMKEMENVIVGWDEEHKAEMMKKLKKRVKVEVEVEVKDSAHSSLPPGLSWSDPESLDWVLKDEALNDDHEHERITGLRIRVIQISE